MVAFEGEVPTNGTDGPRSVSRRQQNRLELLRVTIAEEQSKTGANNTSQKHKARTEPALHFDAARDTQYATASHLAFEGVLTVFTQEWVGVRAAAGSIPGAKLAISKSAVLDPPTIAALLNFLDDKKIHTVLVQGFSEGLMRAAKAVRIGRPETRICAVWHGAIAAWCLDDERALANAFLDLASRGVFDAISIMKRGAHLIHPKAVPYLVPNLPPRVGIRRLLAPGAAQKRTALFGSWNNTWKNMYANLLAAALSPRIDEIFTFAKAELPIREAHKIRQTNYGDRAQHFALLSTVDLALNATVVDCHPMIELEAISVGTPVLRAQLDLDFGAGHPFEQLMTVSSPHSIEELVETIERIASVPSSEISDIIEDYRKLVETTSFERYGRFLQEI